MKQLWLSLVGDVGVERAVLLVVYVIAVVSSVLALLAQLAVAVLKRIRGYRASRDLGAERERRRRELDAAMQISGGGRVA